MCQQHFARQYFGIFIGMDQRTQVHRQQHIIELTADGGIARGNLKTFDGVDKPQHFFIEMHDARMRFRAVTPDSTGHFDRPVRRNIINMPVVREIDVLLSLLVVINRADHFAGRIGIISSAAQFQFFWLHIQVRIFVQLEQLFLDFLHDGGTRAAFEEFTHFNRQHLFLLEVVQQIRTRQQVQRANQAFAEWQVEDVFHRTGGKPAGSHAVEKFGKARSAVHDNIFDEHHVVQTKEVDGQIVLRGQFQDILNEHFHADRDVTDADEFFELGVAEYRLSDHTGRVGEVDHPRVRTDFFDIFNDVKNDRNGTQAFKQATYPVGFLPQIAVAQRNTFIELTRF